MRFCLFLYAVWICLQPGPIYDLWWQLRVGDEIRIFHHIPSHDEFSWICRGTPIVLHEWGSCLIFAECYRHLHGLTGIWILQAFVAVVILQSLFVLLDKTKGVSHFIAFLLAMCAGRLLVDFFSPRPHIFSYLCLLASLAIVLQFRCNARSTLPAYACLTAIQILWANLHAAGPMFAAVCLCFGVGDLIQSLSLSGTDLDLGKRLRTSGLISLACAAISLMAMTANPFGMKIYSIFLQTVSDKVLPSSGMATEWQPVNFHDAYGKALEFYLFLVGFTLAATKRRQSLGDIFALVLLLLTSFLAVRNGPILGLAGSMILAKYIPSAFERLINRYPVAVILAEVLGRRSLHYGTAVVCCMSLGLAISIFSSWRGLGHSTKNILTGVIAESFELNNVPVQACDFILKERIPASLPMYNDYNDGGFIIWRLPKYPVFISTEAFVYFGSVFSDYSDLEHLPFDWRSTMDKYKPQLAIMGSDDGQAHLFIDAPDWAMVYADPLDSTTATQATTFVFIKRTPANAALIQSCRRDCPQIATFASQGFLSAR